MSPKADTIPRSDTIRPHFIASLSPIRVRFDWEPAQWGLVMRTHFPGGHIGPNRYPHCKVSDSGHLCFWDTKLAIWVPMFRLTNAQLFEWMKSIKVLDMELR